MKKILKPFSSESKFCFHLNVWAKTSILDVTKVSIDNLDIIGWEFFKDLVGNFGKGQRRKVNWLLSQLGCQEGRNLGGLGSKGQAAKDLVGMAWEHGLESGDWGTFLLLTLGSWHWQEGS